jgi:3-phosphoshikimate 1-carboxyvinyltransferase
MTALSQSLQRDRFEPWLPANVVKGSLRVETVDVPPQIEVAVSGSKSFTNRALVLAGMCQQPVLLKGVLFSDDSYWGFHSLQSLGFELTFFYEKSEVLVSPPQRKGNGALLNFGMAGTLARFFPAVVLNFAKTFPDLGGVEAMATGEKRLCQRPLEELTVALRTLGANIQGSTLPLKMSSSNLEGKCEISGSRSGQFLSGLLLAAAGSRNDISILRTQNLVQPDYVKMTISAIQAFGGSVDADSELNQFRVNCVSGLQTPEYSIEADASTACYFLSFAVLHNLELTLTNMGSASLQPDIRFVDFLCRLGANITLHPNKTVVHRSETPVTLFKGGFSMSFFEMSDQALTAGVMATFCDAPIEITDVEHTRHHESDRIGSLVANLRALGVEADEIENGFKVSPATQKLSGSWKTYQDHRFSMVGFLLATKHLNIEILEPGCVEKTAPDFFRRFYELGVRYT